MGRCVRDQRAESKSVASVNGKRQPTFSEFRVKNGELLICLLGRKQKRLEAKGLVQRMPSATDGRAQVLSLTKAGQRLLPKLSAIADDNDAHFFGNLTITERQQLEKTLKDLVRFHNLSAVPID